MQVVVSVTAREVLVEVSDDGPGIPTYVLPRLFLPFTSGTSDCEHTGLGLFVTRRILEQQGGTIDVESVVGAGATFKIQLRAVETPERRTVRREMTS